jgi:tRNA acetyltransferase TAN1
MAAIERRQYAGRSGSARSSDTNWRTSMDLLVSYPRGCYGPARHEIERILRGFGDAEARVEKSGVPGIAVVHTALAGREAIRRCAELLRADPAVFRFAIKWVPVDWWCEKDLDAMKRLIARDVAPQIGEAETWGLHVERRGWPQHHTAEIVERLAEAIDRKVNLKSPDKLVRVDVLRERVAVSLLRPGEVFSIHGAVRA